MPAHAVFSIKISIYFRFASWSPSTTTDNPFKYKINSGKETSFPVIEVNGPPIKLPSFSVSSNFKGNLLRGIDNKTVRR